MLLTRFRNFSMYKAKAKVYNASFYFLSTIKYETNAATISIRINPKYRESRLELDNDKAVAGRSLALYKKKRNTDSHA